MRRVCASTDWFRLHFPDVTNGYLQKLLRSGQVRVDLRRVEAKERPRSRRESARAEGGAHAARGTVHLPRRPGAGRRKPTGEFIEGMILYEDEAVLVLNKPFGIAAGRLRHSTAPYRRHPRWQWRTGSEIGRGLCIAWTATPTTGVLLVAKRRDAAAKLGKIFQTRSAARDPYGRWCASVPHPTQGKIEAALVKASGPDGDRVRKSGPDEQKPCMRRRITRSWIGPDARRPGFR